MMLLFKDKRRLLNFGAVLVLALILLWPAYVNGEPFYMTDTSSYLRGADAAVHSLTGYNTIWTTEFFHRFPAAETSTATPGGGGTPVVLAGRSIYYGSLLYLSQFFGNFWAIAVLQALLVSCSISITIEVLRRRMGANGTPESAARSTLLVGVLLAAFTPVGYFCSYLMPDIFGALGLLAFGHLALLWDQNSRASRAFWFALLLAAMLFHTANLLLTGLLAATAAVCVLVKAPTPKVRLGAVVVALVVAVMGQALFSWSVKHATGAAPIRPPFIAARIIDDGPGLEYLRDHCPQAKLIFCRATRFRSTVSDSLLWSRDPDSGIFQALSPSEQRVASAQQTRFVLAVFADRPLQLLGSSAGAILRQAGHFDLDSFNYTTQNTEYFDQKLPRPFIDDARNSKAFRGTMPVRFVEWSTLVLVLLSLIVICWRIFERRQSGRLDREAAWLLTLVVGIVFNAAICGALSTPKGRYEMRLIWVLPLAALATRPRPRGAVASSPVLAGRTT